MTPRHLLPLVVFFGLAGLLATACDRFAGPREREPRAALSVPEAMSEADGAAGYLRAVEPRDFSFPADHGPHPGYRTEWWYFTGNLDGPDDRRFGYQLTFFRSALAPPGELAEDERASAWATDEAWLAHFGLTGAGAGGEDGSFHAGERLARGAAGLAGVRLETGPGGDGRLRVWTEDWSIAPAERAGAQTPSPAALAPLRLRAVQPGGAIDLRLAATRPPFLHGRPGEEGLSRKSEATGDASYYYTIPRFETRGTVTIEGETFPVRGLSWLDREWSTSALSEEQTGWDWFSLQLSDGRDLMLYRLRLAGGGADPASSGTLMTPEGEGTHLAAADFRIEPTGTWRAPGGAAYPSGWRVRLPSHGLDLTVEPIRRDQELDLSETGLRYWEGAVDVRGESAGRSVTGRGYVELTGYAEAAESLRSPS